MEEKIIKCLKESPMHHFSLGSKELFHSNFLYWLGVNYREYFEKVMSDVCSIQKSWPTDWKVKREYKNLDLCVLYNKDGKEHAFIVLENKVKRLPSDAQLKKYEKTFAGFDDDCSYVVLSLVKCKVQWLLASYEELATALEKNLNVAPIHVQYVKDYCDYVRSLSALVATWEIEESAPHLQKVCEELRELRVADLKEKLYYSQMARMLAEEMIDIYDALNPNDDCWNKGVIVGEDSFETILNDYGVKETVFVQPGFFHSIGLLDVKIKMSADTCFVIQLQGDRYCFCIERKNIYNSKLTKVEEDFVNFEWCKGLNKGSRKTAKLLHYGNDFVYKYQKVENETVGDLLTAIKQDVKTLLNL